MTLSSGIFSSARGSLASPNTWIRLARSRQLVARLLSDGSTTSMHSLRVKPTISPLQVNEALSTQCVMTLLKVLALALLGGLKSHV